MCSGLSRLRIMSHQFIVSFKVLFFRTQLCLRGKGGVPWVQIMENEFEYLADRGRHGSHLGEKFVKKCCS